MAPRYSKCHFAKSYQSILDREGWVDEAGNADLAAELVREGRVDVPTRLVAAGFDRLTPQLEWMFAALRDSGCVVEQAAGRGNATPVSLCRLETSDTELRAAGAWAGRELSTAPDQRLAIVVTHLEQDAPRSLRLIKEGLIPGWQNAGRQQNAVVNVSYGKKLADYPAISTALLALRWLHGELSTRDVCRLLRSPLLGRDSGDDCVRLELRIRTLPDRPWSPEMLLAEAKANNDPAGGRDGLQHLRQIAARRAGPRAS